jgi:aldehyde dehydrogenase (NAD+)
VAFGGSGRAPGFDRGWFVEPTLFVGVDNRMEIAQDEVFGPVLAIIPFEDDAAAVRIANDSPYGLAGAVTSGSKERALDVARRMRTGAIGVNGGSFYAADLPYGGYKASGIGRQNGFEGFEQYLETKSIGVGER